MNSTRREVFYQVIRLPCQATGTLCISVPVSVGEPVQGLVSAGQGTQGGTLNRALSLARPLVSALLAAPSTHLLTPPRQRGFWALAPVVLVRPLLHLVHPPPRAWFFFFLPLVCCSRRRLEQVRILSERGKGPARIEHMAPLGACSTWDGTM